MFPAKIYVGQIVVVFGIVVTSTWGATQWVASALGYQDGLGSPWFTLSGYPVYLPWRLFEWWFAYEAYAPRIFERAGAISAGGGIAGALFAVANSVWRARQNQLVTTYGSARWALPKEIINAGLFQPKGVFLGWFDDNYLRHDGPEHVMCFAPTRSGKGVGLVLPTLLSWTSSAVVHDIKGENWHLTAGWRSRFSHCLLFDPTNARSARYNPLLEVRKGAAEVRDVQNIADILVDPEGALERRTHWEKTSHALLVGVILHVLYAEEKKTLTRVTEILADPAQSFEKTLRIMMATNHLGTLEAPKVHPVVAATARELLNKSENERSGVLSTAVSFLGLYRDPTIGRNTETCDWRIADLVAADKPVTLYLVVPPSDISRTKPLIRLILNQIGRRLTEHDAFVLRFQTLSKDAQCLLIRMVNRRGAIFNRTFFRYAEISDVERAADDLLACGQARTLKAEDYAAFVACLPKDILVAGAKAAGRTDIRVSWPKAKLADYFLTHVPFEVAAEHCGAAKFIALDDVRPLEFLLYLYFGKTEEDLKNFALRDLGIMRTNKATSFRARFTDGEEARACFHYSRLLDRIEVKSIGIYQGAVGDIFGGPSCPSDYAADLRSRAACQVGQFFEKLGEKDLARQLYRAGSSPECNERLVRLLYGAGDKTDAEDLLRRMIDDPASDGELVFATDFYARKFGGRRTGSCTELLRAGVTLTVDDTYRGNPEAGVAGVMRRRGYRVFFAENTLWHSLFGLLFWDELFESDLLHSSFDWVPHCLNDRSFAHRFAAQIDDKLEAVRSGSAFNLLLRPIAANWGRPNGIFAWDHVDVDALRLLLSGTSGQGIATIIRLLCRNFRDMRDGFPDLMLEKDGAVSFMEIKAEGDVIRRNQLTRLRQLGSAGIRAEIGRVDYRFDPEQDYVVVDVETTGGRASGDRITEIGAVKIRNHQVVDDWHSLVNPQRAIPAKITQITGITNEMVRGAPIFAEVADSFMRFMGDGIFVAHNVNFDYGFISHEYERLDRRFRFPKLCTVAGMRRRYPGHKSYGLGKLCELYGIELETHHRALCDARATGHLLNLMNLKREGCAPDRAEEAA